MTRRLEHSVILITIVLTVLGTGDLLSMSPYPEWVSRYGYACDAEVFPIRLNPDGCPIADVAIGEDLVPLLFDTGCSADLSVHAGVFDSLCVAVAGTAPTFGEHQWTTMAHGIVADVCVWGTEHDTARVFRNESPRFAGTWRGLLGPRLLAGTRVTIDYQRELVAVSSSDLPAAAIAGASVLDMVPTPITGRIFVWLTINGTKLFANLDTGASRCVVDSVVWSRITLAGDPDLLSIGELENGGLKIGTDVKLDDLSDLTTMVPQHIQFVIGADVLKRNLLTLDYVNGRVLFQPYEAQ
jgi:hypothetical protein